MRVDWTWAILGAVFALVGLPFIMKVLGRGGAA
jgi:hypothetical protein